MKKTNSFVIQEIVCRHVFNRDGQNSFRYFRPVVLDFLDWFREEIGRPVYVNNWLWNGPRTQRGLRCNLCDLVSGKKNLYMSGHVLGSAIDFNVKDMSADNVRMWIELNISRFFDKFPEYARKCRLESGEYAQTWVHIDFYEHNDSSIIQYVAP